MLGYDIEAFLRNERGFVPAERILGGKKGDPDTITNGLKGHPDNIMAEISSAGPFDPEELPHRIVQDRRGLEDHVAPLSVIWRSFLEFSSEFLETSKLAKEVGCDIDYLRGRPRDTVTTESLGNIRCCGGHLHFDLHRDIPPDYAAAVCDVLIGVKSIELGDFQGPRRQLYGLPGLYRPKPYGVEYRTLSNFWFDLKDGGTEEFCQIVDIVATAFEKVDDSVLILPHKYHEEAAEIILTEDQDRAGAFMEKITKGL